MVLSKNDNHSKFNRSYFKHDNQNHILWNRFCSINLCLMLNKYKDSTMRQLFAAILSQGVDLPCKRESLLEQRFFRLIASGDFYCILQLYLQSSQVLRQELLNIIAANSHFSDFIEYLMGRPENYLSHLFLAAMHAEKAKQAHPTKQQIPSNSDQIGYMVYNAQSAYELFIKALNNSKQDVLVYANLINNLQYLSETKETAQRYYQHGLQWDKNCFYLHQAMSNLLQIDSFEGRKEALTLARQLTKKSMMGSANHHLIAQAHIQEWLFLGTQKPKSLQKNYFKNSDIQDEINDAYALFSQTRLRNSGNLKASQTFMFCFYMSGDKQKLTNELAFNQNYIDFTTEPWNYLGFSKWRYNLILRLCGLQSHRGSLIAQGKILNN